MEANCLSYVGVILSRFCSVHCPSIVVRVTGCVFILYLQDLNGVLQSGANNPAVKTKVLLCVELVDCRGQRLVASEAAGCKQIEMQIACCNSVQSPAYHIFITFIQFVRSLRVGSHHSRPARPSVHLREL